jgi:hypothetical protein
MARIPRWFRSGLVAFAVLALAATASTACKDDKAVREMPERKTQTLEPGTKVAVEFPADGQWHASGFVVESGDTVVFEPVGAAARLGKGAVQVHIGQAVTSILDAGKPVRISTPGEVMFKAVKDKIGHYPEENIQIRILNQHK